MKATHYLPFAACYLLASAGAQTREPLAVSMPAQPPAQSIGVVNAFPQLTFSQPLSITSIPGETNRLFVVEKTGTISVVPDLSNPMKGLFLDLKTGVNDRSGETFLDAGEQGLLGLAFHPAKDGRFFVVYNVAVNGSAYQRLSELQVFGFATGADMAGEKVLIEMRNEASNHNGGDIHFGADGYLYMGWGDEGSSNDSLNNSQRIDKDFWSGMIRIDVDLEAEDYTVNDGTGEDDTNIRPNTHAAIKADVNGNPRYEIPADNPWIGATSFLGRAVSASAVRTEFYAVGLRNPWRFSFDRTTGALWLGDVGQGNREEVDRIVMGGNYEWAYREGFAQGVKWNQRPSGWTGSHPPVIDYGRGGGATQGTSITGGVVYRGTRIQSLVGKYVFADYGSGNIWKLDESTAPASMVRIAGQGGIVGFGHDPSNGDILMADINSGRIRRLVAQDLNDGFPRTLAETGLFTDAVALTPAAGLVAYDVNLPFWSDNAIKRRWFGIPDAGAMVGFSREGNWTLPEGMVWVKHFDIETSPGVATTKKRLETRVIVRNAGGNYGVSYRWNEAGTVATLAAGEGEEFDVAITDGGNVSNQRWRIPSRAECSICHSPQAGTALSFRTRQLNRTGSIQGTGGNFIQLLEDFHYLENLDSPPPLLPRHIAPTETAYTTEERARAYLEVNCAYCHNDGGTVPAEWDARAVLPLFETGLVNGISQNGSEHPGDRLIVPGLDQRSIVVNRAAARNDYTRMPPIGSNVIDAEGVQLLTDWINGGLTARQDYAGWRESIFGNPSVGGEEDGDDDIDGRTNREEFLAGTDPKATDLAPALGISVSGNGMDVTLPAIPGRGVTLYASEDLIDWEKWIAPGNDGLPRDPAAPAVFTIPTTQPMEFFRAGIEER